MTKEKTVICRLEIELEPMNWVTIQSFDNIQQAEDLALTLHNNGVIALVCCACGAYPYGECEPCADEEQRQCSTN